MSVWLWENDCEWLNQLVLWDGESTYWTEEMNPSGGYKKIRTRYEPLTRSRFVYIGELE